MQKEMLCMKFVLLSFLTQAGLVLGDVESAWPIHKVLPETKYVGVGRCEDYRGHDYAFIDFHSGSMPRLNAKNEKECEERCHRVPEWRDYIAGFKFPFCNCYYSADRPNPTKYLSTFRVKDLQDVGYQDPTRSYWNKPKPNSVGAPAVDLTFHGFYDYFQSGYCYANLKRCDNNGYISRYDACNPHHTPYEARYAGCFVDKSTRDLPIRQGTNGLSTNECIETCMKKGYTYAGRQGNNECWCGNNAGSHGKVGWNGSESHSCRNCYAPHGYYGDWKNCVFIARPDPAIASYSNKGKGWCVNSAGRESTARYFEAADSVEAAAKKCNNDKTCVGFAFRKGWKFPLYSNGKKCTKHCDKDEWIIDRSSIKRGNANDNYECYVKFLPDSHYYADKGKGICVDSKGGDHFAGYYVKGDSLETAQKRCLEEEGCVGFSHSPEQVLYYGTGRRCKQFCDKDDWFKDRTKIVKGNGNSPWQCYVKKKYPTKAGLKNVAEGKHALQSSTYGGYAVAQRAVDGNINGKWYGNSVTHTNNQSKPWWEVNLGGKYQIKTVSVYNRIDCCSERLNNFDLIIKNDDKEEWRYQQQGTAGQVIDIDVPANINGNKVMVQLRGSNYLQLAEVEVYA